MGIVAPLRRGPDCALSLVYYRPGEEQAAHRHHGPQLTLLLAGDYREESEDGTHLVQGPALGAKPAGFEHANRFGAHGALILSVCLADAAAVPAYGVRGTEVLPHAEREAAALLRAVEARLDDPPRAPPLWLDCACRSLAQARPVSAVAAELGMHPVAFARSFRRHVGAGPAAYRQARRLARALPPILLERVPLAEAAAEAGFADQAHLSHALRRATGFSPGQLRMLLGRA
jgi:AraC-like DNA-binding protein